MKDTMKIISKNLSAKYEVNKSIFISNLFYVENVEDAINFFITIKKKYYDAKHNCYGYIIGNNIYKTFDDGEPQGSAGIPILNILKNNNIVNCIAIVTRYFGGVLLGVSGLYKAYSESVKIALKNDSLLIVKKAILYYLIVDYVVYNYLKKIELEKNIFFLKQNFNEKVNIEIIINNDYETEFINKMKIYFNFYKIIDIKKNIYYVNNKNCINIINVEGL